MPGPVIEGEITDEGVLDILAEIEKRRTSGLLHFDGETMGDIVLVAGQIAVDQKPLESGDDPVETFLAMRSGKYHVHQRLPVMPVSKGDDSSRRGSLAVHVPADLMNYCERAGLTGSLELTRNGKRAEVVYDRGALIAIQVDGSEDDDLHDVFSWEDGKFRIVASAEAPTLDIVELVEEEEDPSEREPTLPVIRRDDTGQNFLKVVEVALTSILEEREKRRSPSRTSPPLPPAPKARQSDRAPGPRKDPTVKVIYLRSQESSEPTDPKTRHLHGRSKADHELPEAAPERRAHKMGKKKKGRRRKGRSTAKNAAAKKQRSAPAQPRRKRANPTPSSPMDIAKSRAEPTAKVSTHKRDPAGADSPLHTVGWVALLMVVFFVALFVLAKLPPL